MFFFLNLHTSTLSHCIFICTSYLLFFFCYSKHFQSSIHSVPDLNLPINQQMNTHCSSVEGNMTQTITKHSDMDQINKNMENLPSQEYFGSLVSLNEDITNANEKK